MINDNNGWTKINSPDDLPKEKGSYTVFNKDGKIETWTWTGHFRNRNVWLEYFTHWRPVEEIPKPIY